MAVSDDDKAFALELFEGLGGLTTRKMMGGLCLYHQGQIFAILDSSGGVFLKASGAFASKLTDHGATQFGSGSGRTMGYWTLPLDALDDPAIAVDWARAALKEL